MPGLFCWDTVTTVGILGVGYFCRQWQTTMYGRLTSQTTGVGLRGEGAPPPGRGGQERKRRGLPSGGLSGLDGSGMGGTLTNWHFGHMKATSPWHATEEVGIA